MEPLNWQISNATQIHPDGRCEIGGVTIRDGVIAALTEPDSEPEAEIRLNLHGQRLYAGLVNAHDTLLATWHPVRGSNWPYLNWLAFDNELKSSTEFRQRMVLSLAQLYRLGGYKNLISAATSVVDHIPHYVRQPYIDQAPVRLLTDFGIAHSISSYALEWGEGIAEEYQRAEKADLPFILHIAEGFDLESKASLQKLRKEGGLGPHTVLVHGLSLSESDLDLIAEAEASIIWCPSANHALYNRTLRLHEALRRGINVAIGSDAAMTGGGTMLDTLKKGRDYADSLEEGEVSAADLYRMATLNGATALRWPEIGRIEEGAAADLFVLNGKYLRDPFLSLVEADLHEISLVVIAGIPLYGDLSMEPLFDACGVVTEVVAVDGIKKIVVAGVGKLIAELQELTGDHRLLPFLPIQ